MLIALSILSVLLAIACTVLALAMRNMFRFMDTYPSEFGNPARAKAYLHEMVRQVIKGGDWRQVVVLREDLMDAVHELDTHGPRAEKGATWYSEPKPTAQQTS